MSTETSKSSAPVWLNDSQLDPQWLSTILDKPVQSCSCTDISNDTRRSTVPRHGATIRLSITLDDQEEAISLILKQVPDAGLALSQRLGLAREALFYSQLAPLLPKELLLLPQIWYAAGDMESGHKWVLMEDLSNNYVDSGILFGPGNPNNWNRDLPSLLKALQNVPSARHVARITFLAMARVHATYWRRNDLLRHSWLRGCEWVQGRDRESFQASQQLVRDIWNSKEASSSSSEQPDLIRWDPLVRSMCQKAIQSISWQAQTTRLNTNGLWTLVHGDCWPGNVLIDTTSCDDDSHPIRVIDWEMVGLGSGPQELGQYILSNMDPIELQDCEYDLVRDYWNELVRCGIDVSWDYCWREYTIGGVERWLWFLIYFLGQESLLSWAQFFHDQIAAFVHHHKLTADDITQPRP